MACSSSDREQTDPVKQQVAAHWDRRAAHFDEDLGHSIRTAAERAAWDRILDLTLPAADALEALDIGCGTGFLSLELAFLGHRVTGVDFAPSMIAQARKERRMEEKGLERRIRRRYACSRQRTGDLTNVSREIDSRSASRLARE